MNTDEMIQPVSGRDCVTGEQIAVVHADDCRAMEDSLRQLVAAVRGLDLTCSFDVLNPCWGNRPTDVAGKHWGAGDACNECTVSAALAKCNESALVEAK